MESPRGPAQPPEIKPDLTRPAREAPSAGGPGLGDGGMVTGTLSGRWHPLPCMRHLSGAGGREFL